MKIKKWDIIIIALMIAISFLPYGYIKVFMSQQVEGIYAYITIEGEFYKEIPLTGQRDRKQMELQTPYGTNIIQIENEGISVVASDCKDHTCESFGVKSKVGDVIVCLPHQLYIELRGSEQQANGQDARGY